VSSGSTQVYFADLATFNKFQSLVNKFNLPQGKIVPKGFGTNPWIGRIDLQFSQEFPGFAPGHQVLFTADLTNLGNLLNKKWGVVKEYSDTRTGTTIVNADCANAAGQKSTYKATSASSAAAQQLAVACSSYYYSYANASTATNAAKPSTIDKDSSVWQLEFGLKYKF
jgi:hypothetical protein